MSGVRQRLLPLRMITTDASAYGSDNYGDKTYGTRASDTADLQPYVIAPRRASATDSPMMERRIGDTEPPFECWLVATGTLYDDVPPGGERMKLDTVEHAYIRFSPYNFYDEWESGAAYAMEVQPGDQLHYEFTGVEFAAAGAYRVNVILFFDSGRRMTVSTDDNQSISVIDMPGLLLA